MTGAALPEIILAALVLALAGLLVWREMSRRRELNRLDDMLGRAVRGAFDPSQYDETQLSKIESRMSRFLSASHLKSGQMAEEQAKVHSLIGDISHQTKTPIANILLYTDLLREQRGLSPETLEYTGQINGDAEKLNFLVASLVKAARLESGILKVVPAEGDVGALVEEALREIRQAAAAKQMNIVFPAPGAVCALYDAKWCAEALCNILDNAVKYTPPGGSVRVSLARYELFVRIDVADTGKGIAEGDLPRVFGRFWRAANSAGDEGVGIGLYLARQIVTACGGYIKVASTPGKGSVFSVFLPTPPAEKSG